MAQLTFSGAVVSDILLFPRDDYIQEWYYGWQKYNPNVGVPRSFYEGETLEQSFSCVVMRMRCHFLDEGS